MLALGGRRAILRAAAMHCTSEDERRDVEQAFPKSRGVVIPLGIDQQFLDTPMTPWTERSRDPYVLVLSRVHPKKNLEAFIQAFVQTSSRDGFQHWRLVIAGSGEPEYVSTLEQLVRDLGAARRVSFVGWAEGDYKHELIRRSSVFAIASFHENFGVSLLEALASAVPAVVSRRVELSEAVDAAGAGWIVDTSVESLAAGLAVALGDADQRHAKSLAAREFARRFSWNNVAIELVDLYSRIRSPLQRTASLDQSRSAGHSGAAVTR
jgi:glycosyltransferase involved in cell wall biosynthesis